MTFRFYILVHIDMLLCISMIDRTDACILYCNVVYILYYLSINQSIDFNLIIDKIF